MLRRATPGLCDDDGADASEAEVRMAVTRRARGRERAGGQAQDWACVRAQARACVRELANAHIHVPASRPPPLFASSGVWTASAVLAARSLHQLARTARRWRRAPRAARLGRCKHDNRWREGRLQARRTNY
eukprot:813151-Pleurochrysis_carterae.AAC.2